MSCFLLRMWRILTERPSNRIRREREAMAAAVLERRVAVCPNADPCAQRASEEKQEELAARVTTLVNKMQVTAAKTDLLWEENERRKKEDPTFQGPEKRVIDLGPPIERLH